MSKFIRLPLFIISGLIAGTLLSILICEIRFRIKGECDVEYLLGYIFWGVLIGTICGFSASFRFRNFLYTLAGLCCGSIIALIVFKITSTVNPSTRIDVWLSLFWGILAGSLIGFVGSFFPKNG